MTSKLYTEQDYDMLADWWRGSFCPVPHKTQLETLGYIGYNNDKPMCALFAYRCKDVPIAFLEHFITTPEDYTAMQKMKAVVSMMDAMLDHLGEEGYVMVRGTTWSKTLGRVCNRRWGFEIIGDGCTNMSLMLN